MLHAPMQKESQLFELGCGTRYAQTGPRPIFDAVLSRCIPYLHLSLSQPTVMARSSQLSLMAVATIKSET